MRITNDNGQVEGGVAPTRWRLLGLRHLNPAKGTLGLTPLFDKGNRDVTPTAEVGEVG